MTAGITASPTVSAAETPSGEASTGYHYRDAIRLLFILALGSEPSGDEPDAPRVFRGEKRAMAIDFLVRYPDFLADELLTRYEAEDDAGILDVVEGIFAADEPDVRLVRMVRWHRGAFQNIETPLAILRSRHLVRPLRQAGGQRRHDFVVEPAAFAFMRSVVEQQPSLAWYRERAELVMTLAKLRSGSSLKDDQYLHPEYKDAPLGTEIPSIKERVLARLRRLREAA
ncbi:hypothetical protein [Methylobacterium brachythecii]|uniref:Uncharacterized protein n=1 Tax=Methylobacterium brachythecii TaxID=1176177 RepID=A0A7W6F9D0_9HYPH|nr:hypothetical protein [Methylobacterium brachythecii]MBB3905359.1 hypothetical protein [Methylobacterium brachythecii]GLS45897.1 hypothetical protein GCM10007884_38880 [Methylobacterium brachythecii]